MIEWLSFALAGVIAGLIAGMLGLGGGLVIVPILVVMFAWQGIPAEFIMHLAIGTSMLTITVTACSSILAHHRHQNIRWQIFWTLLPGLMAGALVGALLASSVPGDFLKRFFAVFALALAIRVWIPTPKGGHPRLLNFLPVVIFSNLTGILSAMVGIGGGTLVVPYLLLTGQKVQVAIGTAAACGLPIALAAVAGFILFAPETAQTDHWQTGFIHWQAFLGIISTSIFFAPLGVKLAKAISPQQLRRLFSISLLLVSGYFFSL